MSILLRGLDHNRFVVGLLVKVVEEQVEEDSVGHGEADGPAGIAAVRVEQLGRVQEGQAELDLKERKKKVKFCFSLLFYE